MPTGTISTYEIGVDLVVEWKIENFFNLSERDGAGYFSPDFSFGGETWYFGIYPNGSSGSNSSGHVNLELCKCHSGRPIKQSFSLSLKTATGEKYNEQNVTKDFNKLCHSFNRFIQRSDLTRRIYELVPDGVLTVVCTMKSSTSAGSASNTASTCDKCCHCKITFNAQNLSSHQRTCMHRPIKCPDCLEVIVLQKWLAIHKCQKERSEDYYWRGKLLMALCIASILIDVLRGCVLAYSKTPLSSLHPCGDLVMSNEHLQEKIAELEAVAETLKARESELNAIKKEHGELKYTYESIASEKNKLQHCLDSEKQNLVHLKKEMEEKQSKIDSITKELRKKETDFNDFKNKNEKLILKIKEIESEKKLLEEKATENENHNSSKDHGKELAVTIIIFIIAIACVYVYSGTSLSVQHPYGEGTQTISAEEDNIVKADLSEVAETDEPEASNSKTCATETEGPITFNNPPEDCGFVTDINHLLKENRGVDVTFELETPNGKTKLFAHKLILAVMSSYFADEFYDKGRNHGHQVIPLKGIDPKAFEQMIRYCYGESPIFKTNEEVCVLFKIASKFKVISLQNLCLTSLRHTKIEPGNIFSILEISVEIEDKSLKDMCFQTLQEKTREVMAAYELCDVTPAMVYTLLKLPKLSLNSEYEFIKWIFDWAKVKSENAREYLERLLKYMNFLALRFEEFATLCKDYQGFFNSDEIVSIYQNIAHTGTREMPEWFNKDLKCRVYTGSNE